MLLTAHAGNTVLDTCPHSCAFEHVLDGIALVRGQQHIPNDCSWLAVAIVIPDNGWRPNIRPIKKLLNVCSGIVCLEWGNYDNYIINRQANYDARIKNRNLSLKGDVVSQRFQAPLLCRAQQSVTLESVTKSDQLKWLSYRLFFSRHYKCIQRRALEEETSQCLWSSKMAFLTALALVSYPAGLRYLKKKMSVLEAIAIP